MSNHSKIQDLSELLKQKIGAAQVLSFETRPLTGPGDNYGSEMLALDVVLSEGTLSLVAKRPPRNPQLLAIFQTSRTFIKENCIYTDVAPFVAEFEKEVGLSETQKLHVFCECFGARISLSEKSTKVDENALLLLENLRPRNFSTGNRLLGFDSEHSRIILENLAKFHATFVALKLLKPNSFKDVVFPSIDKIDIDAGMTRSSREAMISSIKKDVLSFPRFSSSQPQLLHLIDSCIRKQQNLAYPKDHPFITVIHNDFWVNNILVQHEAERPVAVKIIDFQLVSCDSLVHDVLFFIFTSIRDGFFEGLIDMWLTFYHEKFKTHLEALKCPIEAYSYENFMREVNRAAPWEFYHILSMLRVVLAKQEELPNLEQLSDDIFADESVLGEEYFSRLEKVIEIYVSRNWMLSNKYRP